ncbi:hypothetical protein EVAR_12299_1 [Eumeta japonica]|uniref:Uncharacterized protein n=1 Tax=Eumeta variegata TaxID=151549 RepID=A0A4C1TUA9_EUMVA|nr:hypothetical protein EVAR_12299_1 [Eumeta japonica]
MTRYAIILVLVAYAHCMPAVQKETGVVGSILGAVKECIDGDLSLCLKEKALRYVDIIASAREMDLADGIKLVGTGSPRSARALELLPEEPKAREAQVENMLVDSTADLLENRVLQFRMPSSTVEGMKRRSRFSVNLESDALDSAHASLHERRTTIPSLKLNEATGCASGGTLSRWSRRGYRAGDDVVGGSSSASGERGRLKDPRLEIKILETKLTTSHAVRLHGERGKTRGPLSSPTCDRSGDFPYAKSIKNHPRPYAHALPCVARSTGSISMSTLSFFTNAYAPVVTQLRVGCARKKKKQTEAITQRVVEEEEKKRTPVMAKVDRGRSRLFQIKRNDALTLACSLSCCVDSAKLERVVKIV